MMGWWRWWWNSVCWNSPSYLWIDLKRRPTKDILNKPQKKLPRSNHKSYTLIEMRNNTNHIWNRRTKKHIYRVCMAFSLVEEFPFESWRDRFNRFDRLWRRCGIKYLPWISYNRRRSTWRRGAGIPRLLLLFLNKR